MKSSLLAAVILLLAAAPADAGVLSKVVHGMKQKSGQSGGNRAAGGGDGADREDRRRGPLDDGPSRCGTCTQDPTAPIAVRGYRPAYLSGGGDERVELYLGLQSVKDSNHAAAIAVRALSDGGGASFTNTSYFERVRAPNGSDDTLRLDVWDVTVQLRLFGAGPDQRTQLWLAGGFSSAGSEDLELYGASLGARLTHNFGGELGAEASVRNLRYQDDISGVEGRVGMAVSLLRLSYRYMKFNVGPPLKGPEFGIALQF